MTSDRMTLPASPRKNDPGLFEIGMRFREVIPFSPSKSMKRPIEEVEKQFREISAPTTVYFGWR
jgi:hypothetical protein